MAKKHPLRVSLVTETYAPEVNGVARTLEQLVNRLRLRGHTLDLVLPEAPGRGAADTLTVRGLPLPGYPAVRGGLLPCRRRWTGLPGMN